MPDQKVKNEGEDVIEERSSNEDFDSINSLKADISCLIKLISLKKKECEELDNETQYMKEYAASFISTGDLKR